ncbi:hypothetical protein BGZ75_005012 [Mortierella antarctica]|nr:hypothetical protein BGZ75_005012 [Mortierella antarctica]
MPPPPDIPLTETEELLIDAYNRILNEPFEDKYEDLWEDEPFDRAVEEFQVLAQEIGFIDPFQLLSRYKVESCDPCVQAGPELSYLADEFEGRLAVVGINNESIFGETKPPKREYLDAFLDDHRDGFRYTIYLDSAKGHAKEIVYKPAGYRGIPCVVLILDGVVVYVGSPQESFRPTLEQVLRLAETEFARED